MQEFITQMLIQYQFLALFAGAVFFGETVILMASFLAAQGSWSVWNVFWIALVGTIVSDCVWFLLGDWIMHRESFQKHQAKYERLVMKLDKKIGNRPYLSLLIIKFLYGTRILTIIYLSFRKIKFWQFLVFDFLGTSFWLVIVMAIGWLAGKGYTQVIEIFHSIGYGLSALILFFILYRIVNVWISKKVS